MNWQYVLPKVFLNEKHTQSRAIYWLVGKNVVFNGSQEPNPVFLLGELFQYSLSVHSNLIDYNKNNESNKKTQVWWYTLIKEEDEKGRDRRRRKKKERTWKEEIS
jgi:hypothetical protein